MHSYVIQSNILFCFVLFEFTLLFLKMHANIQQINRKAFITSIKTTMFIHYTATQHQMNKTILVNFLVKCKYIQVICNTTVTM